MLMSHSKCSKRLADLGFFRAVLCLLVAVPLLSLCAVGQQAPETCSISGTAGDAKGPIANVTLRLTSKDDDRTYEARTNAQGKYQFSALHPGVFMLHAEVAGFVPLDLPPVFVSRDENKTVDFTLQHTQAAPSAAPEFYDEPQFNVAGVTDTTSLGGHGSDVVVRTRDKLAKDTASLSKTSDPPPPETASEKTLRDSLSRDPSSFEANHQLGELLLRQDKDREALIYLDRAAKIKPDDYQNTYDQALANTNAGNYDRSRT